ncbi:MAG: hypothetical protein OEZ28_14765 [Nitrospinota bacterium]|nr:hypothetical protein [Nitrospinota bacterium]
MRSVGLYRRIRQAYYRDGKAIRELSRETGLHRDTIRKMLIFSIPPGYRREEPPRNCPIISCNCKMTRPCV